MGSMLECKLKLEGKSFTGTAALETDFIAFTGGARLKIPFSTIQRATVENEALTIVFNDREAVFVLGAAAEKWRQKILHPKSLLDKLGVKAEHTVAVLRVNDDEFLSELKARGVAMHPKLQVDLDMIFLGAEKAEDLSALEKCKMKMKRDGAIWVVNPKGVKIITEAQVLAAGKKAGLVDVKVVKFSETHTAHKFVIPKAMR